MTQQDKAMASESDWRPRSVTGDDDIDDLLLLLLELLLDARSPDAYFEHVRALTVGLPPEEQAEVGGAALPVMARALWNVVPLPWAGFRVRPVAEPEPGAPCFCGSGRAFRHCCLDAIRDVPPLEPAMGQMLLPRVLRGKDRKAAIEKGPPMVKIGLAHDELIEGRPGRAKRILTALLKKPLADASVEADAIDLLGAVFKELGQIDTAVKTLSALTESRPGAPASAAYRVLSSLAFDDREFEVALELARRARSQDPHNSLAGLAEIQALGMLGRFAEIKDNLEFWREVARERSDPVLMELFEEIEASVPALHDDLRLLDAADVLPAWRFAVDRAMKEPLRPPRIRNVEGSEDGLSLVIVLQDASVQALEDALREEEEDQGEDEIDLPAWLLAQPLVLQSPAVLERVLQEAEEEGLPEDLVDGLVAYRRRLLEHYLAPVPEGAHLPWENSENRGLLIALYSDGLDAEAEGDLDQAMASYERLLALEPRDVQGARRLLVNALLREGQNEAALEWIERYPGSPFPDLPFGAVLALVRLGRTREAEAAFRDAHKAFPRVLSYLSPDQKKQPKLLDGWKVHVGGKDQAWYYREEMRGAFAAVAGLLPFMNEVARRMKQGR